MTPTKSIDILAIRARIKKPLPPHEIESPIGINESLRDIEARKIYNGWLDEWTQDRRDLQDALKEIEVLRESRAPELIARLKRVAETKKQLDREMLELGTLSDAMGSSGA